MPYTATDGLLQENIDLAERIAASIISHMHTQVAEQTGVGIQHPYAYGTFAIEHSKEGAMFVAQLKFYPSSTADGTQDVKAKVVEKGKSSEGVVDALQLLRHYIDPTRLEYLDKRW